MKISSFSSRSFWSWFRRAFVARQTSLALGLAGLGRHAHPFQLSLQGLATLARLLLLHGHALGLLVEP